MHNLQTKWSPATRGRITCPMVTASRGRASLRVTAHSGQSVPVTISITKQVDFGDGFKAVGNQPCLGSWDVKAAPSLKWSDGHVWAFTAHVPVGVPVCFKLVRTRHNGAAEWEGGDDRKFTALGDDFGLNLVCNWNATSATKVESFQLSDAAKGGAAAPSSTQPNTSEAAAAAAAAAASAAGNGNGVHAGVADRGAAATSISSFEETARATGAWVGAEPEFVRSRKDRGERVGVWATGGLAGAELELVNGDKGADNWLAKLGLLKSVLVDKPAMMRPQLEALAAAYVYATWVNTGAISCVESGGHHRPCHHAEQALQMFRSLEWVIGDAAAGVGVSEGGADARILAARRMHTRLPSISGEFRVSTPLTRIRDIAHRNDIPKALKDEIKHTLQNKLHRSAGPEDLVATEAMLARVTATPGEYPEDFVREFRTFTHELREFFNASGLVELLDTTLPSLEEKHRAIVTQFLAAKSRVEEEGDKGEAPLDDLMAALFMGTQARAYYAAGLAAGMRNDVPDNVLAMRQRWRLAEIRLEDHAFVTLSRIIQQLEAAGGASMLAKGGGLGGGAWRVAAAALTNGLRHLGLSQFATKELLVLENELEAWVGAGGPLARGGREGGLRARASAERCLRIASQYSDLVMRVYSGPAGRLGAALGVPEHMARVFGESEVRASVAFQVSKLSGMLVRGLRLAVGQDAWDGLVPGEAVGRLVEVAALSPAAMEQATKGHTDNVVLLVQRAEGDEEVGPLGPRLAGVVLAQELPHLSHLGVRARQEKVTFAMCDDAEYLSSSVRPLLGKTVRLRVALEGVSLSAADKGAAAPKQRTPSPGPGQPARLQQRAPSQAARGGAARKLSGWEVVALRDATVDTCGSKAAKCGELEGLARDSGGMFTAPPGVVLPFGAMELALSDAGELAHFTAYIQEVERPDLEGGALDAVCEKLQQLVGSLPIPLPVIKQVVAAFPARPHPTLLAVRSSANVEDLAGMSAAGLYDSIVGVPADNQEAVASAIAAVWASLYTRRAVLSRRAAGVPQSVASMAVLIMELVAPEVSFVLHTARPSDANTNIVMAELAPGQGETLASGTRGSPWRLEIDKATSKVDTLAFANFSHALVVPSGADGRGTGSTTALRYNAFEDTLGGAAGSAAVAAPPTPALGGLVEVEVDYSKQRLTTDDTYREQVGRQLARVGMVIEGFFGQEPQDIEGGLVSHEGSVQICVFQSRPQL